MKSSDELKALSSKKDSINSHNWTDGPHIEWLNETRVKLVYYKYSAKKDRVKRKSIYSEVRKDEKLIHGRFGDKNSYYVEKRHEPSKYEYIGIDKLMVIGDVHGEYDSLVSLLKKSGIVDDNLNWKFGKGHLIFLGDIFDKGPKVTESLWLIKNLSHEAEQRGGKLHIILGNHEIMNLNNIYLYNSDKYERLSQEYPEEFKELYSRNTELGRWIRTWSTVLKIDDKLIVHGGISPQFLEIGMKMEELNSITRKLFNQEIQYEDTVKLSFLFSDIGPYMYRGYVMEEDNKMITEEDVDNILLEFDVNRIIFGHTERKYFQLLYNNKLMGIDVPLRFSGKSEQALYFTGNEIYKIYNDGSRVKLQ